MEVFQFSKEMLLFKVSWGCGTSRMKVTAFDTFIERIWKEKANRGLFRYRLNIPKTNFLSGKYRLLTQLNPDRATNRRPPEEMNSLRQPFDPKKFNFTLINPEEIICPVNEQGAVPSGDCIAINVSPLERFHCLILPQLYDCLPQVITLKSLHLALNLLLLSGTPATRVGFNSLCGYASVNHLHFHMYRLDVPMLLETIEVKRLTSNCFELLNFPAVGFAFQVRCPDDINPVLEQIFKLVTFFCDKCVAHNLYFTRGCSFETAGENSERNCVRIYVWARESSCGAKSFEAFNPALCELFGHIVVKTEESYNSLTEEEVSSLLADITQSIFQENRDEVKHLLS